MRSEGISRAGANRVFHTPAALSSASLADHRILESRWPAEDTSPGGIDCGSGVARGGRENLKARPASPIQRSRRIPKNARPRFFGPPEFSGRPRLHVGALRQHALSRTVTPMSETRDHDETIHVRLPTELRAELEREAARECRTLSGHVRFLISSAREARSTQQPAAA